MVVVDYAVDGTVARLTLDSPRNRNALSSALVRELRTDFSAAANPAVRAVVLGHTGNTFCAGRTCPRRRGRPREAAVGRARELTALLRGIVACPKPVIVAIDGHVRAGGMGLVGRAISRSPARRAHSR